MSVYPEGWREREERKVRNGESTMREMGNENVSNFSWIIIRKKECLCTAARANMVARSNV